jgi:hypothetical protein
LLARCAELGSSPVGRVARVRLCLVVLVHLA